MWCHFVSGTWYVVCISRAPPCPVPAFFAGDCPCCSLYLSDAYFRSGKVCLATASLSLNSPPFLRDYQSHWSYGRRWQEEGQAKVWRGLWTFKFVRHNQSVTSFCLFNSGLFWEREAVFYCNFLWSKTIKLIFWRPWTTQ